MFKRYSVRSALGNAKQWSVCLQIASIYRSRRVIFSNFYMHVSNEYGFHMCIFTVCAHFTLPLFHILNSMPVFAMPATSRFTCPDIRVSVLRFSRWLNFRGFSRDLIWTLKKTEQEGQNLCSKIR